MVKHYVVTMVDGTREVVSHEEGIKNVGRRDGLLTFYGQSHDDWNTPPVAQFKEHKVKHYVAVNETIALATLAEVWGDRGNAPAVSAGAFNDAELRGVLGMPPMRELGAE